MAVFFFPPQPRFTELHWLKIEALPAKISDLRSFQEACFGFTLRPGWLEPAVNCPL